MSDSEPEVEIPEPKVEALTEIENILEKHPQTNQYRDGNKKVRFNLEWSMLLGHTTNALGAKSFETPHNFKQGRGVYIKPVEERKIPKWKKELWGLCQRNSLVWLTPILQMVNSW